ncbi:uncharacterized protein KY384_006053 [Bacidia gigantensis]|uniref:uncharacterized protein n=1 Tax=Bacidia gigantensis TaxID=2732470 RepID=UPI001D04D3F3|nr:uncharacterized protein KY384_006053 [Bacidia gigantensis]KAG8529416.1 hypothetical protein KY384_006053 [Bacidia gigantensis]
MEATFAVNYLANLLLILLLLQSMDKKTGRVVLVASWTHDPAHALNAFITAEEHKTIFNGSLGSWSKPGKDEEGDDYNAATDVLEASFDEAKIGKYPKAIYLNGNAKVQSSPETRDEQKQRLLWSESVKLAGIQQEETVLTLDS